MNRRGFRRNGGRFLSGKLVLPGCVAASSVCGRGETTWETARARRRLLLAMKCRLVMPPEVFSHLCLLRSWFFFLNYKTQVTPSLQAEARWKQRFPLSPALWWDCDQQSPGWTAGSLLQLGEKVSLILVLAVVPTGAAWLRCFSFSVFKGFSFLLPPVTAAGAAALVLAVCCMLALLFAAVCSVSRRATVLEELLLVLPPGFPPAALLLWATEDYLW